MTYEQLTFPCVLVQHFKEVDSWTAAAYDVAGDQIGDMEYAYHKRDAMDLAALKADDHAINVIYACARKSGEWSVAS